MKKRILNYVKNVKCFGMELKEDESGMELLQIVILCLIAVIVGGTLLTFFDTAFTDIGALMVDKIKSIFKL